MIENRDGVCRRNARSPMTVMFIRTSKDVESDHGKPCDPDSRSVCQRHTAINMLIEIRFSEFVQNGTSAITGSVAGTGAPARRVLRPDGPSYGKPLGNGRGFPLRRVAGTAPISQMVMCSINAGTGMPIYRQLVDQTRQKRIKAGTWRGLQRGVGGSCTTAEGRHPIARSPSRGAVCFGYDALTCSKAAGGGVASRSPSNIAASASIRDERIHSGEADRRLADGKFASKQDTR